jgi:hypothetical protein
LAVFHGLERGLKLEPGAEHVREFLGEEHDFLALELDRAVGDRGFFGVGLALGAVVFLGFRLGAAAGFFGGYGRSGLLEIDGLEAFFVENAQGFRAICGVDFPAGDGTIGGEGFVGEDGHGIR